MKRYLFDRVLSAIPTLLGMSVIVFALLHLVPGDPVRVMYSTRASPEQVEELRRSMGLDRPLVEQYFVWIRRVLSGDLGASIITGRPVFEDLSLRLPVTLELGVLATLLALALAIPLGVKSATRPGELVDFASTSISLFGLAIPNFVLATLLVYVFALRLGWFPSIGYVAPTEDLTRHFHAMVLPTITASGYMVATVTRMTRMTVLEVLHSDFIRTARAKGLSERRIIVRHGLRAAMPPVLTISGIEFAKLLGGTLVVEQIFAVPGIGRYTIEAIFARDYVVVQGVVLVVAILFVLTNLAVDLLYALMDPRIRLG